MTPTGTRMVMLIDDEPAQQRLVAALAARGGWRTIIAADNETALAMLGTREGMMLDAVILDHAMPIGDSADLVRALKEQRSGLPILMLTAINDVSTAVEAMRAGVADFLVKPIAPDRLLAALDATVSQATLAGELRPLTEKIHAALGFDEIVGSASQFRAAMAIAAKGARSRVPVLIEGEIGVGKEVVAEAVHAASPRAKKPMITVNCGAIASNLIESELFGHETGAFTGAFTRQVGKLIDADTGTVFIDEICAMTPEAQIKLLGFLETAEVCPIGAKRGREVDVRIIAASNTPLIAEVEAGRFREDLFFRLNVVHVHIPPLRDRKGDVPALARHLLTRIAKQPGLRGLGVTETAMDLLVNYGWPGNVRQLQDVLFRAAVLCEGDALTVSDFPHIASHAQPRALSTQAAAADGAGVTLYEPNGHLRALNAIEADIIRLAIGHYRGRMTEVARRLGIGRSTLYRKLAELGISDVA
jgi:DNA-binding NtrC family response regulator